MTANQIEPIDGTVYATDVHPDDRLVYVTVAGDENRPMILMFDCEDLDALNTARKELKRGPAEPDPGAVLRVLNAATSETGTFIHDRVEYRYDAEMGEWVAWARTDIDGDPQPGVTFVTKRKWW